MSVTPKYSDTGGKIIILKVRNKYSKNIGVTQNFK